jgi:hypothetical protein
LQQHEPFQLHDCLKGKAHWGFHLGQRITLGLEKWEKDIVVLRNNVTDLTLKEINRSRSSSFTRQVLDDGTITFHTFKVAYDLYFERAVRQPDLYPDCAPRTQWGLQRLTGAFKLSRPNVQFNSTVAIGQEFGI